MIGEPVNPLKQKLQVSRIMFKEICVRSLSFNYDCVCGLIEKIFSIYHNHYQKLSRRLRDKHISSFSLEIAITSS